MLGRYPHVEYHVCFHHDSFNTEEREDSDEKIRFLFLKEVRRMETSIHRLKKLKLLTL